MVPPAALAATDVGRGARHPRSRIPIRTVLVSPAPVRAHSRRMVCVRSSAVTMPAGCPCPATGMAGRAGKFCTTEHRQKEGSWKCNQSSTELQRCRRLRWSRSPAAFSPRRRSRSSWVPRRAIPRPSGRESHRCWSPRSRSTPKAAWKSRSTGRTRCAVSRSAASRRARGSWTSPPARPPTSATSARATRSRTCRTSSRTLTAPTRWPAAGSARRSPSGRWKRPASGSTGCSRSEASAGSATTSVPSRSRRTSRESRFG